MIVLSIFSIVIAYVAFPGHLLFDTTFANHTFATFFGTIFRVMIAFGATYVAIISTRMSFKEDIIWPWNWSWKFPTLPPLNIRSLVLSFLKGLVFFIVILTAVTIFMAVVIMSGSWLFKELNVSGDKVALYGLLFMVIALSVPSIIVRFLKKVREFRKPSDMSAHNN